MTGTLISDGINVSAAPAPSSAPRKTAPKTTAKKAPAKKTAEPTPDEDDLIGSLPSTSEEK